MTKKILILFISFLFFSESAFALCVKNEWANLRSGPSTGHAKTWKVYQYMPFKVLKRLKKWYKIEDLEGDVHWVYRPLVTEKIKCAVTKKNGTIVRSGPSKTFEEKVFSPVKKYYSVKVLKIEDGWVEFRDMDGDSGWIKSDDLWRP